MKLRELFVTKLANLLFNMKRVVESPTRLFNLMMPNIIP